MSDIEFINGLSFKAPNENAPDFVIAKGWIKNTDLIDYLKARIAKGEDSTNFDLKKSREGKLYAAVDNWKPSGERQDKPAPKRAPTGGGGSSPDAFVDNDMSDIPFATMFSTF